MITRLVIDDLYKKFRKPDRTVESEGLPKLISEVGEMHGLRTDTDGSLVIGSIEEGSPFHKIGIDRIHGVMVFDRAVAVVLPHSIIFLNRRDKGVSVHFKPNPVTFMDKLRFLFHKG